MKEILNDRIYDSTKECLILWDGYGTPQRVPEEKVNDVATDVYNQARRMTKSNMFVTNGLNEDDGSHDAYSISEMT